MPETERTVRGRVIYVAIGLIFAILLAAYVINQVALVMLVLLLTLLFTIIISGPVDYLERRGLGRSWATLVVLGGLALGMYLLGLLKKRYRMLHAWGLEAVLSIG